MLSFEEFTRSPYCKQLVLSDEDTPQDRAEGLRLVKEDQKRQYESYISQQQPSEAQESNEEKRVAERLTLLRNKTKPVAQHVAQQNGNGKPKSRAEYFRGYRKRTKKCPHCGKPILPNKTDKARNALP